MNLVITILNSTFRVLVFAVFVYTLLGYFMDRQNALFQMIGQVVEPMLVPVRKIMPRFGGLDFSPLVLMLLLQFANTILVAILRSLT